MRILKPSLYLSPNEAADVRSKIDLRENAADCLLVEAALATGARESELLMIDRSSIYEKAGSFWIYIKALKGSNDRNIPIDAGLYNRLLVAAKENGGKPFPYNRQRIYQRWDRFRPVDKKFHALRHTFAVELYLQTKDLMLVKQALGHKSIDSTMIYLQITDEMRLHEELICQRRKHREPSSDRSESA